MTIIFSSCVRLSAIDSRGGSFGVGETDQRFWTPSSVPRRGSRHWRASRRWLKKYWSHQGFNQSSHETINFSPRCVHGRNRKLRCLVLPVRQFDPPLGCDLLSPEEGQSMGDEEERRQDQRRPVLVLDRRPTPNRTPIDWGLLRILVVGRRVRVRVCLYILTRK